MNKEEREKVQALIEAGNVLYNAHRGDAGCLRWERAVEAIERLVRVRFEFRFELESSEGLGTLTHTGHFLATSAAGAQNHILRVYPGAKSLAVWTNLADIGEEEDHEQS